MLEMLKAVLFGIVEGITEWLPVSSTGHLILLNEFVKLNVSEAFQSMFDVVIQLGAILAVIVLFFHKLNPFAPSKSAQEKKQTWDLWFKVIAAIIPSGVVGILLDDWMDAHLHNGIVVALMLILYGIAFIVVEKRNATLEPKVKKVWHIDLKTALLIGAFQCLSLVPGTSRSGSTILGAIFLGVGRSAASEFSFFMAIPTMLGASAIKFLKFILSGVAITFGEVVILIVGTVVSFLLLLWIAPLARNITVFDRIISGIPFDFVLILHVIYRRAIGIVEFLRILVSNVWSACFFRCLFCGGLYRSFSCFFH